MFGTWSTCSGMLPPVPSFQGTPNHPAAEDMANLTSHYIMSNRRLSRTEEIAFAVKGTLDLTERMDRMVMMMEARRDSAYRKSKRHEASHVAQSIDQQNDIELRGIEHKPASANGNQHSTQNSG